MKALQRAVRVGFEVSWLAVAVILIFAKGRWFAWIGYGLVAYYAVAKLFVLMARSRALRDALAGQEDPP